MQDLIGIGSEGRMNTPSTLGGNWEWRATSDQITGKLAKRLYKYMEMYGRLNKDQEEEEEIGSGGEESIRRGKITDR